MNKIFIIHDLINFPDSEYGGLQVVWAASREEAYNLALATVNRYSIHFKRDTASLSRIHIEEWSVEELAKEDSGVLASFMT